MSKLAYFVAPLKCAHCGYVTSDTRNEAGTWTHLLNFQQPEGYNPDIYLGREIEDLDVWAFEDANNVVRMPAEGEPIRTLEIWSCPACRKAGRGGRNWAVAVFEGQRFVSMETVELSLSLLRGLHFTCLSFEGEVIQEHLGLDTLRKLRLKSGDLDPSFIDLLAPYLPES